MAELDGKTALITGGSSGIGLATAALFLAEGARVLIAGRDPERLQRARGELAAGAESLAVVAADVRRPEDCRRLVACTIETFGALDVVVNSAGIWIEGPAAEVSEEQWDLVLDTNLKGTFFVCRFAIPELEKTRGCIVNVDSDSGLVGNKEAAVYCASKGGVTLLTRALAVELAARGVRVNAVCPTDVDTPMLRQAVRAYGAQDPEGYRSRLLEPYPLRRFVSPSEVARCILFLSSSRLPPLTGVCLPLDQGLTAGY